MMRVLLFCMVLLPTVTYGAVTYDNVASNFVADDTTATTVSQNFTCTNNNTAIYVGVHIREADTNATAISNITYNGLTFANFTDVGTRASPTSGTYQLKMSVWRALPGTACDGAAHTLQVTTSIARIWGFTAISLNGVNQTTPNDTFAVTATDGTPAIDPTGPSMSSESNDVVLHWTVRRNNQVLTPVAGQTDRANFVTTHTTGSSNARGIVATEPGAASVQGAWTSGGSSQEWIVMSLNVNQFVTATRRPFSPRHYLQQFLDWLTPTAQAFSMRSGPPGGGIIPPPATADYFVAPTGLDTNPGTEAQPWKTIQHAATTVTTAGAIVSVASGTYNERVTFPNSGTAGNEIEFVGQGDSTVVDGGVDLTGWTQSGGSYHSAVWERAVSAFGFGGPVPAHATASGKMIAFLKPGELGAVGNQDVWMNRAVGDAGWLGIQAVCAHYNTVTRCRFEDGTNPNNIDFKIAPERVGIFHVDNKSYLKFHGFKFINGYSGIIMRNFAHHITFENNTILHGYHAIEVSGGAHHITIQNNTTDLQWRYVDHGHSNKNTGGTTNTTQNNILQMLRSRMPITSTVLVEDVGTDVKILTNTFDRTAAAGVNVRSLNNNYENAAYGQQNLEIAGNTIGHCQDYCVQIQLTVAPNSQIHDNTFSEYNSGIRLGQFFNAQGPLYVYRNKFRSPLSPQSLCAAADLEISGYPNPGTSCFTGTAMYWYHNTHGSADCSIVAYSGQNLDNYYFVNNVFSSGRNWVFELVGDPDFFSRAWVGGTCCGSSAPGFFTVPYTWAVPNRIWTNSETVFALPNGHAAINAGVNLSTTWSAGSQGSKPALPGMAPGYFLGTAPDLGAVEKE